MKQTTQRVKKSEELTGPEKKLLAKWVAKHSTKIDAAAKLEIRRMTLDRIMAVGSGSPENIVKIRTHINAS